MLIIRIDVSVCECSSRWDEREMHLTPLLDCFSNSLAWKMHAFLNFFLDLIWKHTRKKVWDWLLQINMTYVNHVTLRRHKSFSFSTTSIQLWIFTIQTNSFQFQGPTSFSSPWLLDSSRSYCQNYCSNTGRTACFNLLGMLFQVTHNFFLSGKRNEKNQEHQRALQEYQAQESNDCMLISHDEKPSSSKDFLNFPLTITQAKMRPTPIIFSNKQLSKIIPRVVL